MNLIVKVTEKIEREASCQVKFMLSQRNPQVHVEKLYADFQEFVFYGMNKATADRFSVGQSCALQIVPIISPESVSPGTQEPR